MGPLLRLLALAWWFVLPGLLWFLENDSFKASLGGQEVSRRLTEGLHNNDTQNGIKTHLLDNRRLKRPCGFLIEVQVHISLCGLRGCGVPVFV